MALSPIISVKPEGTRKFACLYFWALFCEYIFFCLLLFFSGQLVLSQLNLYICRKLEFMPP